MNDKGIPSFLDYNKHLRIPYETAINNGRLNEHSFTGNNLYASRDTSAGKMKVSTVVSLCDNRYREFLIREMNLLMKSVNNNIDLLSDENRALILSTKWVIPIKELTYDFYAVANSKDLTLMKKGILKTNRVNNINNMYFIYLSYIYIYI